MIDYTKQPDWPILCVDGRSFYASVEAVARGLDPRTCLLAVVSDVARPGSVVLAASPALKAKHGIKTGSRLYEVPDDPAIWVVGARMDHYLGVSTQMARILHDYAPPEDILVYSVDEAWVEVPPLLGDVVQTAGHIQQRIERELGLPTGIGIGPNMFLAKVSLDVEGKKQGVATWTYADVPVKLWKVPTKDCWGIGEALSRRLAAMGVYTLGDLAHASLATLERRFGVIGNQLFHHAWGVDHSRPRNTYQAPPSSFSKGITLLRDYRDRDEVGTVLLELCDAVTERARQHGLVGRTVSLSVGYSQQSWEAGGFSHSVGLPHPTCLQMEVYNTCMNLLARHDRPGNAVRQLYVALSNLVPAQQVQSSLFSDQERQLKVARAMDTIRDRFGHQAVLRGRNLAPGRTDQDGKIGGHAAGTRIGGLRP